MFDVRGCRGFIERLFEIHNSSFYFNYKKYHLLFTVLKSQTCQAGRLSLAGSGSGQGQGDRLRLVQEGTLWSGSGTCADSKLGLSFSSQTLRRKDAFRALTPVNSFVAQLERILLVSLPHCCIFSFCIFFLIQVIYQMKKNPLILFFIYRHYIYIFLHYKSSLVGALSKLIYWVVSLPLVGGELEQDNL